MTAAGVPESLLALGRSGLALPPNFEPKRVVVCGAGIAGLTAAYELHRAGHDVQVFEARNRPGGRVWTWRDFAQGMHAEAGAAYVAEHHALVRQYCAALNVPLRSVLAENSEALLSLGGKTVTFADAYASAESFPVQLPGPEAGKNPVKMWREATHSVRAILAREGTDRGWQTIAQTYARHSLAEFLEQAGWSDDAINLWATASQREVRLQYSAVDQLRELVAYEKSEILEAQSGLGTLPDALFSQMSDRVQFGAIVTGVHATADEAAVTWLTASGAGATVRADYVILALPVPALLGLAIYPGLSRAKTHALRAAHYPEAVTVAAQFASRFWEDQPYKIVGGVGCTDLMSRRITYPTYPPQNTARGVLRAVHAFTPHTGIWSVMSDAGRVRQFARDVCHVHGGPEAALEFGMSHSWGSDPYSGGHSVLFDPAEQNAHIAALAEPEHRLVFAGEHTSARYGTVEGAAESGLRAAAHVHHAPV